MPIDFGDKGYKIAKIKWLVNRQYDNFGLIKYFTLRDLLHY
jgi:hypothetical protein